MSYIGNGLTTQSFTGGMDSFNGNASNTVFGLSRTLNTAYDVDVYVENVWQRPGVGYSVSANTITFSSAPSSGSNNVVVVYRNFTATTLQPADGSVSTRNLGTITNINAGTDASITLQANNATALTVGANTTVVAAGKVDAAQYNANSVLGYRFGDANTGMMAIAPNGSNGLYLRVGGNNAVTVAASGNVGINTSSPAQTLSVAGGIGVFGGSLNGSIGSPQIYRPSADCLGIATGATERLYIDDVGRVGIGATPNTNWNMAGSGKILHMGNGAALWAYDVTQINLMQNSYFNGSGNQAALTTGPGSSYRQIAGSHYFTSYANVAAGSTQTSTHVMQVSKDYTLALQGANMTGGTGITFPASQNASSEANTLDDYEEGFHTFTAPVTVTVNNAGNRNQYVKIGQLVYVTGSVDVSTNSNGATFTLSLPFASLSASYYAGGGYVTYSNRNPTYAYQLSVENGGTNLVFYDGGSTVSCQALSGYRIDFCCFYRASA